MNNPPVGLVDANNDPEAEAAAYAHDPHIDPQLSWAGKAEHTSFEVPTVSLHVHERIDPRTIVEAVLKGNGAAAEQHSLFEDPAENPPLREAIDFYQHRHNWTNRFIAGDSLLVMRLLLDTLLLPWAAMDSLACRHPPSRRTSRRWQAVGLRFSPRSATIGANWGGEHEVRHLLRAPTAA